MVNNIKKFKLNLLSDNLIIILDEIISQQELCKLIKYNDDEPLKQDDLDLPANSLIRTDKKVLPYMFNPDAMPEDQVQLRVYFPDGELINGQVIENILIHFDIVCAKGLWLINVSDKAKIRPYEIMKYLVSHLYNRSMNTVGKLRFFGFEQLTVNKNYDSIRVFADMMNL